MSSRIELKIDWATHDSAKYACKNWHYSKCLPVGKLVKFGIWENSKFVGVVIFGRGAAPKLASSFGLECTEVAELVRIALRAHVTPVSRIMAISIKLLKAAFPGIKLLVSFADPTQGHHGGVYQGNGWIYYGMSDSTGGFEYLIDGKWTTCRSIGAKFGTRITAEVEKRIVFQAKRKAARKHRYAMPLHKSIAEQIHDKSKPYPKRVGSRDNAASGFHSEEGGAIPTPALQSLTS